MTEREILSKIRDSIVNLDSQSLQLACREALAAEVPAYRAVTEGMAEGMRIVGEKFQAMEYFLCELVLAGEAMQEGLKILEPHLGAGQIRSRGRIVIGTVRGDYHNIGKNVVSALLKSAGFDVLDIGEDVPPEDFVEAAKREEPDIIGMSALITPAMPQMSATIDALEKAGLRGKLKVIVGGAPVTAEYAAMIGADAYAKDAVAGFNICKNWAEGLR